jgi:hypothetical protein
MPLHAVVTQAPHASRRNGGSGPTARQYFARRTQRTNNGPRIAAVLAGIAPGEFRTVWLSSEQNIFRVYHAPDTSGTDEILDWTPHGVWDAPTQQVLIAGRRGTTKIIAYSEAVGEWREHQMPADFGRQVSGTVHYYGKIARNPLTGVSYFGSAESVSKLWSLNPNTEQWTRLADAPTANGGNGASFEWADDTGRLVMFVGDAQRWCIYNPITNTWTNPFNGLGHGAHAILRYHPVHARHLLVGGTGTGTRASLVTSGGVVTNVAGVPDSISMANGSWTAAHPSGCWLVKTMGTTPKLFAAWPNPGLTSVTWQDLGTAPDAALVYPTMSPGYSPDTVLITSTSGLHAYRFPVLGDDTTLPTITSSGSGAPNGPFAVNAPEASTAAFIALLSNESVTWGPVTGPDAGLFQKTGESLSAVQIRPTAAFVFDNLPHENPFEIGITATDAAGNARSVAITVTIVDVVGTAPTITVQPVSQTRTAGATATFSVTATGSGLAYQWRRNGTPISGATSSSYTTPATTVSGGTANNGDLYSVVVTGDTAPAATSSNATLTVNAAPPPPPPPTGPTLPAVATDATGSTRRTGQTTRMVVEPFTSIEALGTGVRTIATGTTDAVTGEITLTGLAAGTYAVFGFFPSTGATIQGVRFRLVTVT